MNVETLRLQIMNETTGLQDINILDRIKSVLSSGEKDWWDDLYEEKKLLLKQVIIKLKMGKPFLIRR